MLLPGAAVAGPVLVTARSADVATVVVTVDVLLAAFVSVVVVAAEAVLVMVEPLPTCTTIVKVAVAPAASVGLVSVIVPVPPGAGVKLVKPAGWVSETNVVPAGVSSVREMFCASLGPAFVSVIV